MPTRSMIGIQDEDGSIRAVYCHGEGYPSGNGKILEESYPTREDVERLIAGGDMSYLEPDFDDVEFYSKRGEEVNKPYFYPNVDAYARQEYNYYIDKDNVWFVLDDSGKQMTVKKAIILEGSSDSDD